MARLRRLFGRMLAFGAVLLCYIMAISWTGLKSFVVIVPNSPGVTNEKLLFIPEYNLSRTLRETALYLQSQISSESDAITSTLIGQEMEIEGFEGVGKSGKSVEISSGRLPWFCLNRGFEKKPTMEYPKATIIISLIDVTADEALEYLSRILLHTSEEFTDDVIVTAENTMKIKDKDILEESLEECSICRLFFMEGTMYQHRNSAARFARSPILVFIDARLAPSSEYWLEPLIFEVTYNPTSVVSPQLLLRKKKYGIISEGLARIGMTWDMEAVRIPVTSQQYRMLHEEKIFSVNQTSILKEAFAIRKEHFIELDLFDVYPPSSGGEHISFSLKVINCGGDILTSFCSQMILDVPETESGNSSYPRDYTSVSFSVQQQNLTDYYKHNSLVWLDAYSSNIFHASVFRQVIATPVVSEPIYEATTRSYSNSYSNRREIIHQRLLKGKMKSMECETTNYRYILNKYQPEMVAIDRKTLKHGYIRNLDGLFAFGITSNFGFPSDVIKPGFFSGKKNTFSSSKNDILGWPTLVLSTNSSQWVGPFSYTQGMIKYNRMWCITVTYEADNNNNRVSLEPCRIGASSQMFIFKENILRWGGHGGKMCVSTATIGGEEKTEEFNASRDLIMIHCDTMLMKRMNGGGVGDFDLFKIDVEFIVEKP